MQQFTGSTRKDELEKLTKGYENLRNLSITLLAFCLAALVLALLKLMLPSVICLLAMLLLRVTLHKKARNAFTQAATDAALACSIGPRLDQFELFPKGGSGITAEDVLAAKLLPIRDVKSSIGFYQGLYGTLRDMKIYLSDTTMQLRPLPDKKGVPIVVGVWMRILLPKDTGMNFRILSKELLPDGYRREFFREMPELVERDAEKAGLAEKMCLYEEAPASASSQKPEAVTKAGSGRADKADRSGGLNDAGASDGSALLPDAAPDFPPFSSSFTAAANRLFKKTNGRAVLSVQGSTVNVFIKSRLLAPDYNLKTKPDESFLKADPVPEFRDVLELVKAL